MSRAVAALLAAVGLASCGSGDGGAGALAWSERPRLVARPGIPDRALVGRVRNDSLEPIRLRASDVRLLDAAGRRIDSTIVFTDALSKALFPQDRDLTLPDFERERLGLILSLKPGQDAPLLAAWRQPAGGPAPVTIDYRSGSLAIGRPARITADSPRRYPTGPTQR